MSLLRVDGEVVLYRIQTRSAAYKNGLWFYANLDTFGYPTGFTPSGDCWQRTGITGTLDLEQAIDGLRWISGRHEGSEFRLVKVCIKQETEEVHIPPEAASDDEFEKWWRREGNNLNECDKQSYRAAFFAGASK